MGKKARSNKARAAKYARYNPIRAKERRAEKQKKLETRLADLKKIRLSLINDCCNKLKIGIISLKKKIGTLNIKRLTAVMNDSYQYTDWYKLRLKRIVEKNKVKALQNESHKISKITEKNTVS